MKKSFNFLSFGITLKTKAWTLLTNMTNLRDDDVELYAKQYRNEEKFIQKQKSSRFEKFFRYLV